MSAAGIPRTQALGLEEIEVSSGLNQRLLATIPLTEITADDLETISVAVAPNEAFERAGIERADYLTSLDFQIKNDRGQPRVVVSSSQIAREPVLSLLVQARWRGGKILRDYTILLDPAVTVAAPIAPVETLSPAAATVNPVEVSPPTPVPAAAVAPSQGPKASPTRIIAAEEAFYQPPGEVHATPQKPGSTTVKAPMASATSASSFDSATGSYGPVLAKETLWSIATKLRANGKLSMDQVLLAVSEANPQAIQRGTTVNKGAILRIPSVERMQATSPELATKRLAELRTDVLSPAQPAAAVTPQVAVAVKESAPAPSAKPQGELPPVLAAATKPAPTTAATALTVETVPVKPVEPAAASAVAEPAAAEPAAAAVEPVVAPDQPAAPATASLAQPLPDAALDDNPPVELFQSLALAVVLLLFVAAALLLARRRRKSNVTTSHFADLAAPHGRPSAAVTAPDPFGDTSRFSGTKTLSATAQAMDSTQQLGRQQSTQKMAVQSSDFGATLVLEPQMMAALKDPTQSSAVDSKHTDFDRTMQVDVDTLHIDLNDNDPLAEADFHLAYGLYDEAILLLQTAVAQKPARLELQAKLAETYFAAGRPIEFQEIAETLQHQLTPAEWGKLAIMGAQICPDAALFQSVAVDGLVPDADFDLAFGEPEPLPAIPEPKDPAVIDFDIDSALTPPTETSVPDAPSSEKSLDFMLSEISSAVPADDSVSIDKNIIEFDLGSPALNIDIPELSAPRIEAPANKPSSVVTDSLGFDLEELELSLTSSNADGDASGDDFNTKLDLARAYVEMGDNDMARSLLQEVQQQGSDHQQQEATALLQRLPA